MCFILENIGKKFYLLKDHQLSLFVHFPATIKSAQLADSLVHEKMYTKVQ